MPPKYKGKVRAVKTSKLGQDVAASREPPLPFSRPSPRLEPLLSELDKRHVYITSVDAMAPDTKKKFFTIPVATNVLLMGLIVWRIWVAAPYYTRIAASLMGAINDTTLDTGRTTRQERIYEGLWRALKLFGDLCLYLFLWPLPHMFFFDQTHSNPVQWRLASRFRDQEIAIRRSRRWDETIGDAVSDLESSTTLRFMQIVRQATSGAWMRERTSYLLLNKEWDLDWKLMILCTKLVDIGEMSLDDFKTTVLVHSIEFGWVVFEAQDMSGSVKEEEGRKKIMAFKDELTIMGKENLFFRWIELIQYESSQQGGFGPERQEEAMAKAKQMFESQGVDFEQFWAKVGGMEGMPGMD